jgi:3-methyladenine DNA glycosylase AlkD
MRPLTAALNPETSPSEYEAKLESVRVRLFERAASLVEANADLIFDLTEFCLRQAVKLERATKSKEVKISQAELDEFIGDKIVWRTDGT